MAATLTLTCLSLLLLFFTFLSFSSAHNITEILSGFPDYSQFNSYLTQTKLADEINSRQTITVLVFNNAAMSSLSKNPLSAVKNALSLHVLLDYYDATKLHQISKGTTLTTTLYQTTGNAQGQTGFVNITDLKGGTVGFGSAEPGSKLDSTYTKSVKQIPYNISLIEISAPITAPGVLNAPTPSPKDVNITALLEKAGCKMFASLITSSGVLKNFMSAIDKGGVTIFSPSDEAFKAKGVPDLSKLTNAELVSVLLYHAAQGYNPPGTLKAAKKPISTLASNTAGKFDISVTSAGDSVTLNTGVDSSRVASNLLDETPLAVFTVDSVLLPTELFGKVPSPAPAPEPVISPSPAQARVPMKSPSPSPMKVKPPSPMTVKPPSPANASPPEPPEMNSPGGSPAGEPTGGPGPALDSTSGGGTVKVEMLAVVGTVAWSVIFSVLLS